MRNYGITNCAPYAAAPPVGAAGDTYWNTTNKTLYVSDGTAWNQIGTSVGPQWASFQQRANTPNVAGTYLEMDLVKIDGTDDINANGGVISVRDAGIYQVGGALVGNASPTTGWWIVIVAHQRGGVDIEPGRETVFDTNNAGDFDAATPLHLFNCQAGDTFKITFRSQVASQQFDARSWIMVNRLAVGPQGVPGPPGPPGAASELYYATLITGDVAMSTNVETTVVTLGPKLYYGGRKYEIRGTIYCKASVTTIRCLARIHNVTDGDRANLLDEPIGQANTWQCKQAIYRYLPSVDSTKEFRISFQMAGGTGTFTISGTPPQSALLTANDVGAQ